MIRSHSLARFGAALAVAASMTALAAGTALAHPESEGDHPGGCVVTVEPGTVAVGQQFTVEGNFGGASIFLVEGTDAAPAEDAEPAATTPAGAASFSVTFTAEASDVGEWTVWGMIFGSECGDADHLTVTASVPDVAMPAPSPLPALGALSLAAAGALAVSGARTGRGRG